MTTYTTKTAANGRNTALMIGSEAAAYFVGPDHENEAAICAEYLNGVLDSVVSLTADEGGLVGVGGR